MAGAAVYVGIRAISLALTAFLLPRGGFAKRHWSFSQWMTTGDFGHYRDIAEHGYTFHPGHLALDSAFAWYPGYPAAIDSLAWLPGVGTVRAAFTVTAIAGLVAAWGLATLIMKLTGDQRISLLTVAIWAAAPGSMVLSMLYSEALFCALAVWALVALTNRRWLTAGMLGAAAGTVHSTGIGLVVAVVAAVLGDFGTDRRVRWRPLAALLTAPLGLLGYWGYVAWATHRLDGWFWIERQTCHIYFDWGWGTLVALRDAVMDGPIAPVALVLLVAAAAVALAAWSLAAGVPIGLRAYTITIVALAIGTSANWIGAKPRLLLPAFLLALPLARVLAPLRAWLLAPLTVALAAASTWFGLYLLVIMKWAP
jgi:Mannosyltransferase (PIG-V)